MIQSPNTFLFHTPHPITDPARSRPLFPPPHIPLLTPARRHLSLHCHSFFLSPCLLDLTPPALSVLLSGRSPDSLFFPSPYPPQPSPQYPVHYSFPNSPIRPTPFFYFSLNYTTVALLYFSFFFLPNINSPSTSFPPTYASTAEATAFPPVMLSPTRPPPRRESATPPYPASEYVHLFPIVQSFITLAPDHVILSPPPPPPSRKPGPVVATNFTDYSTAPALLSGISHLAAVHNQATHRARGCVESIPLHPRLPHWLTEPTRRSSPSTPSPPPPPPLSRLGGSRANYCHSLVIGTAPRALSVLPFQRGRRRHALTPCQSYLAVPGHWRRCSL